MLGAGRHGARLHEPRFAAFSAGVGGERGRALAPAARRSARAIAAGLGAYQAGANLARLLGFTGFPGAAAVSVDTLPR